MLLSVSAKQQFTIHNTTHVDISALYNRCIALKYMIWNTDPDCLHAVCLCVSCNTQSVIWVNYWLWGFFCILCVFSWLLCFLRVCFFVWADLILAGPLPWPCGPSGPLAVTVARPSASYCPGLVGQGAMVDPLDPSQTSPSPDPRPAAQAPKSAQHCQVGPRTRSWTPSCRHSDTER